MQCAQTISNHVFIIAVQDSVLYNFYYSNITSWSGSQQQCKEDGGHLVILETEREWKFIKGEIQNLSNPSLDEWYIGLRRYTHANDWRWITGELLTNPHWQKYEPSGDGNCVIIAKEYPQGTYGYFNDLKCDSLKAFICEVSLSRAGNRIWALGLLKSRTSPTTTESEMFPFS